MTKSVRSGSPKGAGLKHHVALLARSDAKTPERDSGNTTRARPCNAHGNHASLGRPAMRDSWVTRPFGSRYRRLDLARFSNNSRRRMAVSLRVEFFNIFNRMVSLPNPVTSNPATAPTRQNGILTGGFGYLAFNNIASNNQNNT
jgi:hypothetical protein